MAVSERLDEFGDTNVAVITFTDPTQLPAYREHLDVPFPVVADVDRTLYRALGLERGALHEVWSLRTLRLYASLLRRGRRLKRTTEDTRQLGADVIVRADGRLVRIMRPPRPDARPTVDELVSAVEEARRSGT